MSFRGNREARISVRRPGLGDHTNYIVCLCQYMCVRVCVCVCLWWEEVWRGDSNNIKSYNSNISYKKMSIHEVFAFLT